MKKIKITFEHKVPDVCTRAEIREWAEFHLGAKGRMDSDNPIEAKFPYLEAENVNIDA